MAYKRMFAECVLRVTIGHPCLMTQFYLAQVFLGVPIIVLNPGLFNVGSHNAIDFMKSKIKIVQVKVIY